MSSLSELRPLTEPQSKCKKLHSNIDWMAMCFWSSCCKFCKPTDSSCITPNKKRQIWHFCSQLCLLAR